MLALLTYACIELPLLLKFVAGVSPIAHFRAMGFALLIAFSTQVRFSVLFLLRWNAWKNALTNIDFILNSEALQSLWVHL